MDAGRSRQSEFCLIIQNDIAATTYPRKKKRKKFADKSEHPSEF
jgi:hypothetical protein